MKNGTLPLRFPCVGIHNAAVCAYIMNKWGAQFYREAKAKLSQCVWFDEASRSSFCANGPLTGLVEHNV